MSMRNRIDMQEIANMMQCIVDYEFMANSFTQMVGGEESEPLREYWNTKIIKRDKNTWLNETEFRQWCEVDVHLVSQMWGNTSAGWQTIGGSAMTNAYTLILENKWYNFACIYYSGKLAYICEMDERYNDIKSKGYRGLPGYGECKSKLSVIFKKPRQ